MSSASKKRLDQRVLDVEDGDLGKPELLDATRKARPFIKWAGGKQRLMPLYKALGLLPQFTGAYYEGFVGGGAAFFYLQPKKAILIDSNADLVTTYNVVKSQVRKLIEELKEHERRHYLYGAHHYYTVRAERPSKALDRAARFIYLNKTCYNGLYRVNSSGEFNVPMGDYKNPRVVDEPGLIAASKALKSATIKQGDYQDIEEEAASGDFAFFDPPYDPLDGKASFTAYTKDNFGPLDQSNLRDLFKRLAAKGVKSLISNSDTRRIRDLYDDWWIFDIPAARAINSNSSGRSAINELAITNFRPRPRGTLDAFSSGGVAEAS